MPLREPLEHPEIPDPNPSWIRAPLATPEIPEPTLLLRGTLLPTEPIEDVRPIPPRSLLLRGRHHTPEMPRYPRR